MAHISSLPSATQRFWDTSAARDKLGRNSTKIVTISSHPAWPGRHEDRDDGGAECEVASDSVHLMRVFHDVLERVRQGPVLNMEDESVTTGQMVEHLWRRITVKDSPIRLNQLLRDARSERAVICLFLALLELVRLEAILLRQDRNLADILVRRNSALSS
jgi:segregation and condensation protein A